MSVSLPLTVCDAAFQSSSPCLSPSLSLSASLSYSRCVSARWFLRQAVMVATPPLHHVKFFFLPRYDFPMIGCWQQNSLPTGGSEYIFMNMNSTLQRAVQRMAQRTVLSTVKTTGPVLGTILETDLFAVQSTVLRTVSSAFTNTVQSNIPSSVLTFYF